MAEYDYNEGGGGSGFMVGLLTGTVLGAGLGMLFAPKSGSEIRSQISDTAGKISNAASDQYRKASEVAGSIAEKGRDLYDKAKTAVRGSEEPRGAGETAGSTSGYTPGPSYGGGTSGPQTPGTTGSTSFSSGSDFGRDRER